jgi:outer membrane protein OmpA-like peptidoglycan-associated protein
MTIRIVVAAGLSVGLAAAAFITPAAAQFSPELTAILTRDLARASDHPLTGRYGGSVLIAQTVKAFDELRVPSGPAEGRSYSKDKKFSSMITAQGKVTRTIYMSPSGRSSLEVATNFFDAVAAKGFETVFQCVAAACGEAFIPLKYRWDAPETKVVGEKYEGLRLHMINAAFEQLLDPRYTLFKKSDAAGDTYVAIYAGLSRGTGFGTYSDAWKDRVGVLVEVVEPRVMDRSMVVVSAADIGNKVMAEGRAVFYGIHFDFDKADIKPSSAPQLGEMAKFLTANPQARVFVIGHTDNKGALDYNLSLSGRRADAVVKALAAQYRIDPKRLTPRGLGPLAPVATNRTDDGQAQNRRVEMVEQ